MKLEDAPFEEVLNFLAKTFGPVGAFLVDRQELVKRAPIRAMLIIGIATSASGTLFDLFYSTWTRAMFIESQNGLFFSLAELAILDLAARATPKGCEGLDTR